MRASGPSGVRQQQDDALPERGLHHIGQPPGHRPRLLDVGRLDHDPHQRLGARLAQQYAAGVTQLALRLVDRGRQLRRRLHPGLVDVRDVDQDLREPLHDAA